MGNRLSLLWVFAIVLGAAGASACGDDSGPAPSTDDDASMGGRQDSGFLPPRRDDGGTPPSPGSEMEGAPCTGNAQCEADLACIEVQTASPPLPALNVCARGCATGTDCGTEICFSYTGQMEDAFCANVVRQQFGECGYETTSVCTAGRSCLFFTDTAGVCVDLCVLESGADAGTDDAGTTGGGPLPTGFVECSGTQTCIEGVVLQEMGFEGVCGDLAARGEPCGPDVGAFCNEGDLCAPEDPDDLMGPTRCYQDCSERNATCDEGMCTDIRGAFAYCLP